MPATPSGSSKLPPAQPRFFIVSPDRIGVKCFPDEAQIRKLQAIPDHHWERSKGFWTFPRTRETLERLLAVFRTDWRILDESVSRAFGFDKPAAPKPISAKQVSKPALTSTEALRRELVIRNYSPKTVEVYTSCVRLCEEYFRPQKLDELTVDDVRAYLLHQIEEKRLSAGTIS